MLKFVCVCIILSIFQLSKAVDDPESFMTALEIIRYWGYPAENYDVITKDGYILALQRIPHGRNSDANSSCIRPAVLLVHGQGTDGTQYIMNPPESSPGQSEYNSKVKALLQIGPVGVMHYVKGWTRWGLFWYRNLRPIVDFYRFALGSHEVLSLWPVVYRPLAHLCNSIPWLAQEICYENFELLFGPPAKTFNWTRLPVYLSHFPAGTSTQSALHLAQIVTHAKVEYMDHNPLENMQRYGQVVDFENETPPPYNYSNIDVPVYLYWSRDDWLTNPEGVQHYIVPNIRKHLLKGGLEVPGYNHLDFSLATDCAEKVWLPIANVMRSMENGEICGR